MVAGVRGNVRVREEGEIPMAGWIRFAGASDLWHLQADWDGAPLCGWKGGKDPATRVPLFLHSSFKESVVCVRCTGELAYFHRSLFVPPAPVEKGSASSPPLEFDPDPATPPMSLVEKWAYGPTSTVEVPDSPTTVSPATPPTPDEVERWARVGEAVQQVWSGWPTVTPASVTYVKSPTLDERLTELEGRMDAAEITREESADIAVTVTDPLGLAGRLATVESWVSEHRGAHDGLKERFVELHEWVIAERRKRRSDHELLQSRLVELEKWHQRELTVCHTDHEK